MYISGIWLQSFRNYENKVVQFVAEPQDATNLASKASITILVGANGAGKTSILEAIAVASYGESFRASVVDHMIAFDQEYGRVQLQLIEESSDSTTIEVLLTVGQVQGKKSHKRVFSINGVRKLRKDVVGTCKVVLFRPEDLRLIEGSPSRRRQFLDMPLSLQDWQYAHALKTYEQAIRSRNKLLERVREQQASSSELEYWDALLVEHGSFIQEQRQKLIKILADEPFSRDFSIQYIPSYISKDRMAEYQNRAIAAGHTLIGPHKDDFIVSLDGKDVAAYGSRGQQRLAVLWLKLGERRFLSSDLADRPILLLDDIFSELDRDAQSLIFEIMKEGQTIVTTADESVAVTVENWVQQQPIKPSKIESKVVYLH